MMIRLAASFALVAFCLSAGMADDKQHKDGGAGADEKKPEQTAKAKAEEIAQATLKNDFGKILDLTYPELVKRGGGREKLIASMAKEAKEWKDQGIEYRSVKVGQTSQVVAGGDKLFAVAPFTLEMKVRGGTMTAPSFMLGISLDKGKTWTFVNGDLAHEEAIKKILPALPADLKLPPRKQPVFRGDNGPPSSLMLRRKRSPNPG